MQIFALSDLHIDNQINHLWVGFISDTVYLKDTLIIGGDISDDLEKLKSTLSSLRRKFHNIFFLPGNHELWVKNNEFNDSFEKFEIIMDLCKSLDIKTKPDKLGKEDSNPVWIIPLNSWYVKPEEGSESLFLPKNGEDESLSMWRDNELIRWPKFNSHNSAADFFLEMNNEYLKGDYKEPVISFSHFLPRQELMFPEKRDYKLLKKMDRHPAFNFSRVAGSLNLDKQIRSIGSAIHIYGHQHRNRERNIDGVYYVSHCLGYPNERKLGLVRDAENGPKLIWDTSNRNND